MRSCYSLWRKIVWTRLWRYDETIANAKFANELHSTWKRNSFNVNSKIKWIIVMTNTHNYLSRQLLYHHWTWTTHRVSVGIIIIRRLLEMNHSVASWYTRPLNTSWNIGFLPGFPSLHKSRSEWLRRKEASLEMRTESTRGRNRKWESSISRGNGSLKKTLLVSLRKKYSMRLLMESFDCCILEECAVLLI